MIKSLFGFVLSLLAFSGPNILAQFLWPDTNSVSEVIHRANDYWIANNPLGGADWARSAYFTGNQRAARVLADQDYLNRAAAWASSNHWLIGPEGSNSADAYCCGQTYIDLYRLNPQPGDLTDISNHVNVWMASAATNQLTWIDAFYMAGPTFARFGNMTGNTNYYQKLWQMYSYMKDGLKLFDTSASLWYRDTTYVYPKAVTSSGQKVFWGRGNGWVFAGLARVLQQMPASAPHYQDYAAMFQSMASAIKTVQGADGMWRSSLYDYAQYPNPETSGSGFFTYGLAWGIRSGLLPAQDYTNAVMLAWNGLTNLALNVQGLVGYVQGVGAQPAAAAPTDTVDYGVGAFLLAGSEVYLLATNAPALQPWAGADQIIVDSDDNGFEPVTLDASQTEVYRGMAGSYTWYEGISQITSGMVAQVNLPVGQHLISLHVSSDDGQVYTNTVRILVVQSSSLDASAPILKLDFGFEDSGTSTTDLVSGVSLNMFNSTLAATDLHTAIGMGVSGLGKAADFTSSTTQGGTGPVISTTNNSGINFGTVSAFTISLWIKPTATLVASGIVPRLFSMGTNGTTDRLTANSFQLLNNGTALQAALNSDGLTTAAWGTVTNSMPVGKWTFLAMTYDRSAGELDLYAGDETNGVTLQSATNILAGPINLGTAWSLYLGNRLAPDTKRAFKGYIDDVRFYAGAANAGFLEDVRQSAAPSGIPASPTSLSGSSCGSQITLSWTASSGATGYIIKRSGTSSAETNYAVCALNQFTDTAVVSGATYYYEVIATNVLGESLISDEVSLTASASSSFDITSQPVSQETCVGSPVTFTVGVNAGGLSYDWQYSPDGINWYGLGGNSPSFTTWPASSADNGTKYRVAVSSPCLTLISTAAVLTVNSPVSITVQPADQIVQTTWPAQFSVQAIGNNLTYQWRRNGTNLAESAAANGTTNAALSVSGLATDDSGAVYDCVIGNSCGESITSSPAMLTVLASSIKLQFPFDDNGVTTTDLISGVSLEIVDSNGMPADFHGLAGSGVAGYGRSLNFASAASQGGAGPLAFTQSNSMAGFGTFSSFTATMWVRPDTTLYAGLFPRFFTLGGDDLTDRGVPGSFQLLNNGINEAVTSVQGFANALQSDTTAFGGFDLPVNQWSFMAMTYDGATLRYYVGSETNAVALVSAQSFPAGPITLGASGTIFLGNRLAGDRAFDGAMDDVRFYLGSAPISYLEEVRRCALSPPRPVILFTGNGSDYLSLRVKTTSGASYILETSTGLEAGSYWLPIATNIGSDNFITNSTFLNPENGRQFFRYHVR